MSLDPWGAGTSQFTINQTPQYALPSGATYWPAS